MPLALRSQFGLCASVAVRWVAMEQTKKKRQNDLKHALDYLFKERKKKKKRKKEEVPGGSCSIGALARGSSQHCKHVRKTNVYSPSTKFAA